MRVQVFVYISLFLLFPAIAFSQVSFRTVIPRQPVKAGQSFQVQYIVEGTDKSGDLELPDFWNFRFVSGPNTYRGARISNYVVTLEANHLGSLLVPGATITIDGEKIRSDDAVIKVIPGREINQDSKAGNPDYLLRPGEDVWKKIKQNLFVKVEVDREKCLVGQPVVATFKLYSRLESKSDIIKNPGFYGFTVYDIINLDDRVTGVEVVNGRTFDVHTIRKVQLYPLRAGRFFIDEMEIRNLVEFSRSHVNKRTEQEIIEGIVGKGFRDEATKNTELFESSLKTEPVDILVEPVPLKGRPADFNGAVGDFIIESSLSTARFRANAQASLFVSIKGRGNLTQIGAPEIEWPGLIEEFEAVRKQELDERKIPLEGSLTFIYPFLSHGPGDYELPPINFSYYDPGTQHYKTVSTKPLSFSVLNYTDQPGSPDLPGSKQRSAAWWISAGALIIILILGFYFSFKRRKHATSKTANPYSAVILFDEKKITTGEQFYLSLNKSIWSWCSHHLGLTGSRMNKQALLKALKEKGITRDLTSALLLRIHQTETGIYMQSGPAEEQNLLRADILKILSAIEKQLI